MDELGSMTMSEEAVENAERLRLSGNDAFAASKWNEAVHFYRKSISCEGESKASAKVYSNLAATLCKLSQYDEADIEAQSAIDRDHTWCKAWWRKGVVRELQKDFLGALTNYEKATELDPNQLTYQNDKARMMLKIGDNNMEESTNDNGNAKPWFVPSSLENCDSIPAIIAWKRLLSAGDGNVDNGNSRWLIQQLVNPKTPTSEQFFVQGLMYWYNGMKKGLAFLTLALNHPNTATVRYDLINFKEDLTDADYAKKEIELLGEKPDFYESLQDLSLGFSYLAGTHVVVENNSSWFVPSPPALQWLPNQQGLVVFMVIAYEARAIKTEFRFDITARISTGIYGGLQSFYMTLQMPSNMREQVGTSGSPEEVVEYIDQQIKSGRTWEKGGLRRFVHLQYRGCILYAAQLRLLGRLMSALDHFRWARKFITLATEKFKVQLEGSYDEKGSTFMPCYLVGNVIAETETFIYLRGNDWNLCTGSYTVDEALGLLTEIMRLAELSTKWEQAADFSGISCDVAYRRMPLAYAHSTIAYTIMKMSNKFQSEDIDPILIRHKLKLPSDPRNYYAIIAEHYRRAAEYEIVDSYNTCSSWWGYAGNMIRSGSVRGDLVPSRTGYTLSELRHAIHKAEEAARSCKDSELFATENVQVTSGIRFQKQAKCVAQYLSKEDDDTILPQTTLVRNADSILQLFLGDVNVCEDLTCIE